MHIIIFYIINNLTHNYNNYHNKYTDNSCVIAMTMHVCGMVIPTILLMIVMVIYLH